MPEKRKNDWEVIAMRYVAYIDIMGFKDMVARKEPFEIYNILEDAITVTNNALKAQLTVKSNLTQFTTFSDSILIFSKDDSFDSLYSIIFNVSTITSNLLVKGIPHKGAIAYGNMAIDFKKSIFFGQPLIDCYYLQDELLFYGIIVHGSIEEKIETILDAKKQPYLKSLIRDYKCPLKSGIPNHLTIFPMYARLDSENFQAGKKQIEESLKKFRFETSGQLRKYVDNTVTYIKEA